MRCKFIHQVSGDVACYSWVLSVGFRPSYHPMTSLKPRFDKLLIRFVFTKGKPGGSSMQKADLEALACNVASLS